MYLYENLYRYKNECGLILYNRFNSNLNYFKPTDTFMTNTVLNVDKTKVTWKQRKENNFTTLLGNKRPLNIFFFKLLLLFFF